MQRRAADSFGNRGKIETLQAQPKRLNRLPEESGRPQRKGTNPVKSSMKWSWALKAMKWDVEHTILPITTKCLAAKAT
ncbi:hypothetical protein [Rossellomorea marisflavi]|uniref:hypothetical protein n=1 Tax=Rossellomorea marisflavi TaxID=189381 RepID=UPI00345B2403